MRNGHVVTSLCSGLEDWAIHPLPVPTRARWRMARRNARLRMRRCNIPMESLCELQRLDPMERAALKLYMGRFDRISNRAVLRSWRDRWLKQPWAYARR